MLLHLLETMDLSLSKDEFVDVITVLDPNQIGSFHQIALVQTLVVLMTLFDKPKLMAALHSVDLD